MEILNGTLDIFKEIYYVYLIFSMNNLLTVFYQSNSILIDFLRTLTCIGHIIMFKYLIENRRILFVFHENVH